MKSFKCSFIVDVHAHMHMSQTHIPLEDAQAISSFIFFVREGSEKTSPPPHSKL